MKLPRAPYLSREQFLVATAKDEKVLHLGFVGDRKLAPGEESLHEKLLRSARDLWGVDIDEDGVGSFLSRHPEAAVRTFVGDACNLATVPLSGKFELIIAGDLIHYVVCPADLLHSSRPFLSEHGRLIVTTPNSISLLNALRAYRGEEKINTSQVLWFSMATLTQFCQRLDWVVESHATGYDYEPLDLMTQLQYRLGGAFFRMFPQWGGTLISTLRPASSAEPDVAG
jgi:SAM-dependent methyltransferase